MVAKNSQEFCLASVQNLLRMNAWVPRPKMNPRGRPKPSVSQMTCLEAQFADHFSSSSNTLSVHSRRNEQLHFSA
jgi:hypothetical protein